MTREERVVIRVIIGVIIAIVITWIFNLWMLYVITGIFAVLLAMSCVFLGYDDCGKFDWDTVGAIILFWLFGPVGLFYMCRGFYNLPEKKGGYF